MFDANSTSGIARHIMSAGGTPQVGSAVAIEPPPKRCSNLQGDGGNGRTPKRACCS